MYVQSPKQQHLYSVTELYLQLLSYDIDIGWYNIIFNTTILLQVIDLVVEEKHNPCAKCCCTCCGYCAWCLLLSYIATCHYVCGQESDL